MKEHQHQMIFDLLFVISLVIVLVAALGSPAYAVPNVEQYSRGVGAVAPANGAYPGKTRCVCQDQTPWSGYLNQLVGIPSAGSVAVAIFCYIPYFDNATGEFLYYGQSCTNFEVIK